MNGVLGQQQELSSRICFIVDEPRTSSLDYFGLFSGYQWESLRGKLLRANVSPSECEFIDVRRADLSLLREKNCGAFVTMGESSLRLLTEKRGVDKWQLSPLASPPGFRCRKVIPTFDMFRMNAQFELGLYQELAIQRAAEESLSSEYRRVEERFRSDPPVYETIALLDHIATQPIVACDVETGYGQINTVGFAWSESDAIAINVLPDRLVDDSYLELWRKIAAVLEGPTKKVFQNFSYDVMYFSAYGIRTQNIYHDTMWAMKFLYPELDMNLGNVGRIYTRRPYWKDDGKVEAQEGKKKDWGNVRDWSKHYAYNCLSGDMHVLTELGPVRIAELVRNKSTLQVLSWNEETKVAEFRPIVGHKTRREAQRINWVRIKTEGMSGRRGLCVTEDHMILTDRGWQRADKVERGDRLCRMEMRHDAGTILGTILGDSSVSATSDSTVAYLQCCQIDRELVELKAKLFGGTVTEQMSKPNAFRSSPRLMFNLYVSPSPQLCNLKKLSVRESVDALTPLGIALWLMDDGCAQKAKYSPCMKLALQSYAPEDRHYIAEFFRHRYKERATVDKAGNLRFSTLMSRKLCAELGTFFVPSMRYKMSHPGPDFNVNECLKFASVESPVSVRVTETKREVRKKRGFVRTSYCIEVAGNHNFFTEYGVVANCRDTTGTFEAHLNQRKDLDQRGLLSVYDNYMVRLIEPILEMCSEGMPLDLPRREQIRVETETKVAELALRLNAEAGRELNPNSPKQVMAYLKDCGVSLPKKYNKKEGVSKESADSSAIKKIRLKHPNLTSLATLAEIKELKTQLSRYINFDCAPGEARLRYTLGKVTETLRFAGGTDPWDRGFNIQTIPRGPFIKQMFLAPEGWSFIEVDLRQAESRFVAYDAADPTLIEMLESGADVHTYVTNEILRSLGKDPKAIPKEEFKNTWRQLGKKSGHGANYAMKANVFVETCFNEMDIIITTKQAQTILDSYYRLFPGIPRWHNWIRRELAAKRKLSAPSGWERYFYGRLNDDMFKEAYAWRPQHTIPWITNHMMLKLRDERAARGLSLKLLVQVHDSLILLCPDAEINRVAEICTDHRSWHPDVTLPGGQMWIPVEIKTGKRMSELKDWEP